MQTFSSIQTMFGTPASVAPSTSLGTWPHAIATSRSNTGPPNRRTIAFKVSPSAALQENPEACRSQEYETMIRKMMLGASILVAGCLPVPPKTDHDAIIRRNGGYAVLRTEAEAAYEAMASVQADFLDPSNYPPAIKALSPQIVQAREVKPPVLMIQTMGGFNHRGLLVVLGTNTNYRPSNGHGWVRKELSPGVFEFRE